jgi:regulator of protease activity HflC (stomatin/prohibitin superfamily)
MNVVRQVPSQIQQYGAQLLTAKPPPVDEVTQLGQARIPLDQASAYFAGKDADGRTPMIAVPTRPGRVKPEFLAAAAISAGVGFVFWWLFNNATIGSAGFVLAIGLVILALWQAFWVVVPEGVSALLTRGGRHVGIIGGGRHFIPPIIAVSHLVTRREIPYDAPVMEAPTKDNIRASVDVLITFSVTDPYKFVYSITADDFDAVLQAASQDALRAMLRAITWEQINDLTRAEAVALRERLTEDVEQYGVAISKVNITFASPPADFLIAETARRLSVIQQAEQAERQALALRRQRDEDEIAHAKLIARLRREVEELELQVKQAELRRQVAEIDADTEEYRLSRLEEAWRKYPTAGQVDVHRRELDVARALAGNSRAILQVGTAEDITRAFLIRDMIQTSADGDATDGASSTDRVDPDRVTPAPRPETPSGS